MIVGRLDGQHHTSQSVPDYMNISLGARGRQLQNKNFPSDHKTWLLTPGKVDAVENVMLVETTATALDLQIFYLAHEKIVMKLSRSV